MHVQQLARPCRLSQKAHIAAQKNIAVQVVKRIPYRGPQIQTLAAHTGMVAFDKVSGKRYLLAIQVPGMPENRPVVVYGSRVHITYKVCRWLLFGLLCGTAPTSVPFFSWPSFMHVCLTFATA
jgi:hypothetical protein